MTRNLKLGVIVLTALVMTVGFYKYNVSSVDTQKITISLPSTVVSNTSLDLGESFKTSTQINEISILPVEVKSKVIKKLKTPENRTLLLLGFIGGNAVKTADMIRKLNQEDNKSPIYLMITSPGGSVLHGSVLLSAIQSSQAPVYTICNILCASMAAIIHQYGHQRMQVDRSLLMFHPASGGAQGEVDKMFSMIKTIKRLIDKMNYEIAKRANLTELEFKALWSDELWIDAEDSTVQNFNDVIVSLTTDGKFREVLFEENLNKNSFNYVMPNYENFKHIFSPK